MISETIQNETKVRDGLVWYSAILPALALFLENYALNKYLGIMVWAVVIIIRPLCCYFDRKNLLNAGYENVGKSWYVFLPTVYLFKRCMLLRHNTAIAVVCMICLSYGIIGNGFTVGLMMDDDTFVSAVKNEPMTSISDFKSFALYESFETAADRALSEISYSIEANGDERTVTVKGKSKTDDEPLIFVFKIVHDGYTYRSFKLFAVYKGDIKLEDSEKKEYLKKLFANSSDNSSSSAESTSSV